MTVPDSIVERVETFSRNIEDYKRPGYKEARLRLEFIDPFFDALGWDVGNRAGWAERYKDVVTEPQLQVGRSVRAPDYSFRIGGTPRFLVEAKAPSVPVKDSVPASFQLRRYAFTQELPLSILTDFEEFAVYDTFKRPRSKDSPATARIRYLTFEQYIDEWDWIESRFSKEAVLHGELDRYAATTASHRGTAGVGMEFLRDIGDWRERLARNIALRNATLDRDELNTLVQRLIDRIIFLRIAEDRGIEPYGHLRLAVDSPQGRTAMEELHLLFQRADDKYNSGLFHFRNERDRVGSPDFLSEALTVDDRLLKEIVGGLYYPESPYEFSVMGPEVLGRVYEQFLGKTIRLTTGHRAVVEDKPEVRRAGGVYYTPSYVIEYICDRSITALLEGRSVDQVRGRNPRGLPFSAVDPACGSGSFLLGVYGRLLDWYLDAYLADGVEKHARARPPRVYEASMGQWRLTLTERKRILLDHVFGVDRDAQAVETTKLSLLLKLLEGETSESIALEMFQQRILPDLDGNIKCGNSLIGSDFWSGALVDLSPSDVADIGAFDWPSEFSTQVDAGGFDAVVGNPPYVRIQRIPHQESDYLFAHYPVLSGKTDLSLAFLEKALELVSPEGTAAFVSTSQWTATDYGRPLREEMASGLLYEVMDFGSLPVFQDADTYPAIFVFGRQRRAELRLREIAKKDDLRLEALRSAPESTVRWDTLGSEPWNLKAFDLPSHLRKLGLGSVPLCDLASFAIGDLTGLDAAFVVEQECARGLTSSLVIPYASRGADVHAFETSVPSRFVIYPYIETGDGGSALIPIGELERGHPAVYEHLMRYKADLRRRKDSRRLYAEGADWYRHLRAGGFSLIRSPKLVVKGIDTRCTVGLLEGDTAFNGANTPAMPTGGLSEEVVYALLGLLNSKVIGYHLRAVCPAKLGGFTRFTSTGLNRIPLRIPGHVEAQYASDAAMVVGLSKRLVSIAHDLGSGVAEQKRVALQRLYRATLRELDETAYRLYGLDSDEIELLESVLPDRA